MRHENLTVTAPGSSHSAVLTTYFIDNSPQICPDRVRPLIIICPGGGYRFTSDRESEPVALKFVSMGCHAAVLRYSTAPEAHFPEALFQLAETVALCRKKALDWHIDPQKVIVLGFSAGGHLAASLGVFWNELWMASSLGHDPAAIRPNGLILGYPVITSGPMAHRESFENLLGEDAAVKEKLAEVSLEKQVKTWTPKTFLWHTASDPSVPVENSLLFFEALRQKKVQAELHIYPRGGHGLSLCTEETQAPDGTRVQEECSTWTTLAFNWMKRL